MVFRHFPPRTPARRAGGLLGGRPDLCQFWLSGDRFSCVPNRCRSALGAGRVCECGGLSRKRGAHVREVRATGAHAGARKLRSRYADAHDPRSRYVDEECSTPQGGGGASGRGLAGRVVQGEGDVRLGQAEPKGKEGEGRSACPSRDRRRCSSFPIPAQRGGVRPLRAEASLQGADPRPARVLPRNDARRGSGERRKRRQRRQKRRQRQGCRHLRWVAVGGGGGLPPTCDAPAGCAASALAPAAARHHAPPGTARAPGGGSALRRALSTAGTQSIPAGRSAP